MSRTVTALYDSRAEAEAARERLSSAVRADSVRIIDGQEGDSSGGSSGGLGSLHVSNEDRHAYGEGLRRGGALLCAEVDGHEDADRIVSLLEESASVDLDRRQESWRSEGWTPGGTHSAAASGMTQQAGGQQAFAQQATGQQATGQQMGAQTGGRVVEEQRIPIVEEELRVGKREIERGGARVRSYIKETPVTEQVTLREEHVEMERRPVDQSAGAAAYGAASGGQSVSQGAGNAEGLLQERVIEMRETAEEAVVQKVANVREELIVKKTAEEHVETVSDTVRRTEVDVEQGAETAGRSAFGGFAQGQAQSGSERNDSAADTRADTPAGTDRR